MALPTSGPLTLAQIQTEFGGSNPISLNEYYAGGANVPAGTSGTNGPVPSSGQIAISNFYGTAKSTGVTISYTFSSHTANASLNLSSIGGYSAGQSDITVTINSGIYLYSTSTGSYGLNITGGTTGDTLTIVNNGYIIGQGGNGVSSNYSLAGNPGGPALNLGFGMSSCTINNTNGSAYIAGGGGSGGNAGSNNGGPSGSGGGAGGGAGGTGTGTGGSGGGIGSSGGDGSINSSAGGGGGRILPGSGGTAWSSSGNVAAYGRGGGSGGSGGVYAAGSKTSTAGAGGSANNSGGVGTTSSRNWTSTGGGGGGWGASGGAGVPGDSSGGAGGKAVNTNGKSITWTSGNTSRVYGSVS